MVTKGIVARGYGWWLDVYRRRQWTIQRGTVRLHCMSLTRNLLAAIIFLRQKVIAM